MIASIRFLTRRSSPVLRSATLAPTSRVPRLPSITERATPRMALATRISTRPRPRWSLLKPTDLLLAALFDRMDEAVHRRDHRDGNERHDGADEDHQSRLHDRDHGLGSEFDLA